MNQYIPWIMCAIAAYIVIRGVYKDAIQYFKSRLESNHRLSDGLVKLSESLSAMDNIPAVVDGLTAMAKASADQLDELKKIMETIQSTLAPDRGSEVYEDYATETPQAIRAAEEEEIRGLIRRGIPESEARDRVRERSIYDLMAKGNR